MRQAVALLEQKATPEEVEEYKRFVVDLTERVAGAAKDVSEEERAAVAEVAQVLGVKPPAG